MRWWTFIGLFAAAVAAGVSPCAAQVPARHGMSILAVDTNSAFNFLPPAPANLSTNKEAQAMFPKPMKVQRLPQAEARTREEVTLTIGGKPGELEAGREQNPNSARDAAASQEREKIMSTVTTPLLPQEALPESGKKPKDEKELWINAKPREDNPTTPQLPFDTWVLRPRDTPGAAAAEPEPSRERPPQAPAPAAKFDFTPSPFDLGSATKAPPAEGASSRNLLSTKPMDLPLFGGSRDPGSPAFSAPRNMAPPAPVAPVTVKLPVVLPQSPFPGVEISRDSPFAPRPQPTASPFGGGAPPSTGPFSTPPTARAPTIKPFPTEASRLPMKTREEQAAEKWEKYFEEHKRNF